MEKEAIKHLSLRIEGELLEKFHYVCGQAGRSANSQLVQLMRKFVSSYEAQNGPIEPEE